MQGRCDAPSEGLVHIAGMRLSSSVPLDKFAPIEPLNLHIPAALRMSSTAKQCVAIAGNGCGGDVDVYNPAHGFKANLLSGTSACGYDTEMFSYTDEM